VLRPGHAPAPATSGVRRAGPGLRWLAGPAADAGQATGAVVARLLRLRRGEQVELHSSTAIALAWQEIDRLSPGGYGFVVLQDGPWQVRVTRRRALT
jgi:hypothetical protein